MTVRVLLFAQLKERLGRSEMAVPLKEGATGCDLRDALVRMDPALQPILRVSRLAVAEEYVEWDHPIRAGEEVAIVPPVSGG
jgi:molybdopterin converting factor subunit 1